MQTEKIEVMHSYPFEYISIDVMGGQLPRSKKGNKYLLILVCSVSRWMHAIPLKSLKAVEVADKLLEFFFTFGIPKTLRCDNMGGFKAQLITAMQEKLNIETKFSQPFHFQSHGTAERMNKTVEGMLRKFIAENEKDWDVLMKYLMFALREVLHSGTKYTANQLVFGRQVRGLLDIAKETWTSGDQTSERLKISTLDYIEKLKRNIETALAAARENMDKAQQEMKFQFDKRSTERALKPGEKAILLLPTTANKIMMSWRGPYTVLRSCGNNSIRKSRSWHIFSM